MGCTGKASINNEEDENIEDYDERYDFYNFKSKRIAKNPLQPSKDFSNKNNKLDNNSDNNKEEERNNYEDEEEKQNEENKNKNKKNGDLYRNKNENKNNIDSNHKNSKLKNNNKLKNGDTNDVINPIKNSKNNNKINNKNTNNYNDEFDDENYQKNNNIYNEENSKMNSLLNTNKIMLTENGKIILNNEINNKNGKEYKKNDKDLKKSKINGITMVENLKEYFSEDITKEEIKNLVFEAFGDCLVDDMSLYIPGQTVTYEQANELSNYIYCYVKNKEIRDKKCLQDLNVKIDLVPLNKGLIKEKMFKGKDPSDKQIENVFQSYGGESNDIKVLTIEFQ